jgi:hypothetical protein
MLAYAKSGPEYLNKRPKLCYSTGGLRLLFSVFFLASLFQRLKKVTIIIVVRRAEFPALFGTFSDLTFRVLNQIDPLKDHSIAHALC